MFPDVSYAIQFIFSDFLNNFQFSFFILPCTSTEIFNIINLQKVKSTNLSNIHMKVIKSISVPLSFILEKILNLCMLQGVYPSSLKMARVVPLHKAGDCSDINNYRPISTLSNLNKIFERILHHRIENFIEKHNLISRFQFGFRTGKSTTMAIFHLVQDILVGLEGGRYTICLFLDLKKAFDSVNHQILLEKCNFYGLRGKINDLIRSYLTDRSQYVAFNGADSQFARVRSGVPQGSVLGPLLFNLFFNDICNLSGAKKNLYADDAVLYITCDTFMDCISELKIFLNVLSGWLNCNCLIPNISKTKLMIFGPSGRTYTDLPQITFRNEILEWVSVFEYLGLSLDNRLLFNIQIEKVCSRIARGRGIIYRLSSFFPINILLSLYNTLVYPHTIYNVVIWGGVAKTRINRVNVALNKTLRIILGVRYNLVGVPLMDTNSMYRDLSVLKFSDIYVYFIALFIYSIFYGTNQYLFNELISVNIPSHGYNTRGNNLSVPYFRLEHSKQFPSSRCIEVFNKLPIYLFQPSSISVFKRNLRSYLLSKY